MKPAITFDKKALVKRNPAINSKLLRDVGQLRAASGKKTQPAGYSLEAPLGGALAKLKLFNA